MLVNDDGAEGTILAWGILYAPFGHRTTDDRSSCGRKR